MARVTHVKKAQQRYYTRPVIDPETGEQKKTPMMNRNGVQKTTKSGRPVFLRITEADYDRPKPLMNCDHCHKPIEIGTPYKHISPKSGPYGGHKMARHEACPTWQVWEYSNSLSARISQIQDSFMKDMNLVETPEDVQGALDAAAEMIRELAEEKRESADNIRDGFGHDTWQSEELDQTADDLESWADDVENVDVPDTEDFACDECDGSGELQCDVCDGDGDDDGQPCEDCEGKGVVECENCGAEEGWFDQEAWREAVDQEVAIVDEAPV